MEATPESIIANMRYYCLASTFCDLRLGEHFRENPVTKETLARKLKADLHRLTRLLQGFVWAGFVTQSEGGTLALTKLGEAILLRSGAFRFTSDFFYHPWLHLKEYLDTGTDPYAVHYGKPLFEHLSDEPEKREVFYSAMMSSTEEDAKELVANLSFPQGCRMVDVGGGHGQLAKIVKQAHPHVHCLVLDLPVLMQEAKSYLAGACEFVAGDMFKDLPRGADFYFLKWILHDWDDEHATRLMKHCAERMQAGGKVVIVERVFDDEALSSIEMVNRDLNMLVLNGGRERTLKAYQALIEGAGLEMDGLIPLESGFSAIIGVKPGALGEGP